jgi:hypothetical protein
VTLRAGATQLVAALTLAAAATTGPAAQPAHAATAPTHVAIVVAGIGSACVPWHAGITGAAVVSANFTVTWGQPPSYAGFVVQIDGVGKSPPDLTHYWAYYHNTGGGWVYSGSGAASYQPQPGTVEGWAYDDGQQSPPTPPSTSYAAICAGQDPAPPPTHAPTPTQPPVASHPKPPPATQPGQPAHPRQPTPSTRSSAPPRSATSASARSTAPPTSHHHTTPATHLPAPVRPASSDASHPTIHLVGAKPGGRHTSAAPALGTGLALVAVAALGGAALWRLHRQKHG